jgi:hypothetical protein
LSATEWDMYLDKMRRYRDKFIAHLDKDRIVHRPYLGRAKAAAEFTVATSFTTRGPSSALMVLADIAMMTAGFA